MTTERKAAPAATSSMTRRQEREQLFRLLFEAEFHPDETPAEHFAASLAAWEIPDTPYIRDTYFGVLARREEIDALLGAHARGWKLSRMAAVTRTLLRLAVYEMLWGDVPARAAVNEALELAKIYDNPTAPAFINGVLHPIARERGLFGDAPQDASADAASDAVASGAPAGEKPTEEKP